MRSPPEFSPCGSVHCESFSEIRNSGVHRLRFEFGQVNEILNIKPPEISNNSLEVFIIPLLSKEGNLLLRSHQWENSNFVLIQIWSHELCERINWNTMLLLIKCYQFGFRGEDWVWVGIVGSVWGAIWGGMLVCLGRLGGGGVFRIGGWS